MGPAAGERIETRGYFVSPDFKVDAATRTAAQVAEGVALVVGAAAGGIGAGIMQKAGYLAVTDRRVLVIQARVGAFGPLLENKGVVVIPRAEVVGVTQRGGNFYVRLRSGTTWTLGIPNAKRAFGQQAAVRTALPALLASPPPSPPPSGE